VFFNKKVHFLVSKLCVDQNVRRKNKNKKKLEFSDLEIFEGDATVKYFFLLADYCHRVTAQLQLNKYYYYYYY